MLASLVIGEQLILDRGMLMEVLCGQLQILLDYKPWLGWKFGMPPRCSLRDSRYYFQPKHGSASAW